MHSPPYQGNDESLSDIDSVLEGIFRGTKLRKLRLMDDMMAKLRQLRVNVWWPSIPQTGPKVEGGYHAARRPTSLEGSTGIGNG
ncbi:hypothetical protein BgiBS90_001979 [Biomphalaria glabrata]|nr:hypothetical protein BgiBS90_001979 [Biomphalaria glabrata]